MAITFSVRALDEQAFGYAMGNLTRAVQRGLVDPEIGTLGKQAQLLTEHCMKLTPPNNVGQGKRRVAADVERIFHPIDPKQLTSPGLAELVRRGDPVAWEAAARNIRKGPLAGTVAVVPTPELHQRNRDRRGRAKPTNYVTLWPQRTALRALLRAAQERVGWARAGWLRAYYALGGQRVPSWVARHGAVKGQFYDGRNDPNGPFVEVRNDTGWGQNRGESERIVNAAMRARARAMQSYFNKMMELSAKGIATPWQSLRAQINAQFFDAA